MRQGRRLGQVKRAPGDRLQHQGGVGHGGGQRPVLPARRPSCPRPPVWHDSDQLKPSAAGRGADATEPRPSVPCAIGTIAEATAAADPPDEPPACGAVPRLRRSQRAVVKVDHSSGIRQAYRHSACLPEQEHDRYPSPAPRRRRRAAHPHRLPGDRDRILIAPPRQQQLPRRTAHRPQQPPGRLGRPDPDERAHLCVDLRDPVQPLDHVFGRREFPSGPRPRSRWPGGLSSPSFSAPAS